MNILDRIVEKKFERLPEIRKLIPGLKPRTRPLYSLKQRLIDNPYLSVIAEIKRGSPSLGLFAPHLDIKTQAVFYQNNGASAVSILTDEHFFGNYEDLETISSLIQLPILAKDFMIDTAQITVAHAAGADIILLIAAVLTPEKVQELATAAQLKGLEVILELHDTDEIPLEMIPKGVILGLNNRNLKTFEVSIENGLNKIKDLSNTDAFVIAESGIHTIEQAHRLSQAGFSGLLIGESLIRNGDSGTLLQSFSHIPRR